MNVILTGAAGKIGRVVWQRLVSDGFRVRGVDRRPPIGPSHPEGEFTLLDLLDPQVVPQVIAGADAVVHLANYKGMGIVPNPKLLGENLCANAIVFQAAAEQKVRKIVFSSTVQVSAGSQGINGPMTRSALPYLPADGNTPANSRNPYALSKEASETILRRLQEWYGFQAVSIRFPLVTERPKLRSAPEAGHADMDTLFSWLSCTDAASLISAILQSELPGFRVYFPAARTPTIKLPIPEIIDRFFAHVPLKKSMGKMDRLVDTTAIEAETGWHPTA